MHACFKMRQLWKGTIGVKTAPLHVFSENIKLCKSTTSSHLGGEEFKQVLKTMPYYLNDKDPQLKTEKR